MNKKELLNQLVELTKEYANAPDPDTEEGREQIVRYVKFLDSFGKDVARQSLRNIRYTRTSPYFPRQPDFVGAVKSALSRGIPSAEEAWGEVLRGIRVHGRSAPDFSHELVRKTVELSGGWGALRGEVSSYTKTSFLKTYNSLLEEHLEEQLLT